MNAGVQETTSKKRAKDSRVGGKPLLTRAFIVAIVISTNVRSVTEAVF